MFGLSSQEVLFGFFTCVQIEDCGIQSYSEHNAPFNPSSHRLRNAYARVRYIDERADGQPLARLTPGFLPLIAMSR